MTATFSPNIQTQLDACISNPQSSKIELCNIIKTALGATRRVRCFHDANNSAVNPFLTGTEFLNIGSTGELTISAGNISSLGMLAGATVHQAVNLTSGKSIIRIEGNGEWMQCSLGLPNSGADYIMSANPTTTSGVGLAKTAGIKAPRNMASGTGPIAPTIKPTTPTIVELVDWTNGNAPVVIGTATFTTRVDDFVFDDPEMAAEIGDVAIYQLDHPIQWNSAPLQQRFELGSLLMIASNYNTENGTVQLEQSLCAFKPLGRWASYPASDTYQKANFPVTSGPNTFPPTYGPCTNPTTADLTYPPPFKINLYTVAGYKNGAADRTPLFTHEIKAFNDKPTMPINSPSCSQVWSTTEPLIPHFNCGMMLPWQNLRTKKSAKAGTYCNGVTASSYVGKVARKGYTTNPTIPLIDAYNQFNGQNHLFAMPAYPMRQTDTTPNGNPTGYQADLTYLSTYDDKPIDPNLFNRGSYFPQIFRSTGWRYQPGSITGHDWRTGPGGSRFDRSAIPSILAMWASDPNYVRPLGNVPIRDMVEDWGLAYFNHSNHWLTNVQTFASLPKQGILNGDWVFAGSYYGGGPYGVQGASQGPQNTIDICSVGAGLSVLQVHLDASGRQPYGGWGRDSLHSYAHAGWWAMMLNSPMHAIAEAHDFATQWMTGLQAGARPTQDPSAGGGLFGGTFMVREQAWRWLSYAMMWKVGSRHALSYSQEEVENRFQIELETYYDKIYKPAFVDIDPRPYFVGIRNLGCSIKVDTDRILHADGGTLGLYMAHTLAILKQTGLWAVMKRKNDKCRLALEMMITCNDKYVIDYIMDTKGRDPYYTVLSAQKPEGYAWSAADVPASWAAQSAMLDTEWPVIPANSTKPVVDSSPVWQQYQDWVTKYDGTTGEMVNSIHLQQQYAKMRKTHFPEYPHPRLDAAIAKFDAYYAKKAAAVAQGADDWVWRFASHGELVAPTVVGPN